MSKIYSRCSYVANEDNKSQQTATPAEISSTKIERSQADF